MDGKIISVDNLSKVFKVVQRDHSGLLSSLMSLVNRKFVTIEALREVNFHIEKGEVRALIGPNGAGKSTTIKLLTGILYPTDGAVKVLDMDPWLSRRKLASHIGVLFGQKSQLWWDLPPIDTFYLHKHMYDIPHDVYNNNIEFFTDVLNLSHVISKPVRQLSLGERMKCEFVCALLHKPKLVFLDESTIGLDIFSKEAIRTFVKKVNQEKGTTFIITTHDMSDIEDLCKNVTIMNHGTVVFNDNIEQLKSYFSAKKTVHIKFSKQPDASLLDHFNVLSFNGLEAQLEIDVDENTFSTSLQHLFAGGLVQDVNVHGPQIETIIKDIYSRPRVSS